ncbi:MAG: ADP-ribosylglycohydrolase family protein [Deltaproteobacteria bacterium]|nr:ADP-ribosylglycohydrolase family protein [Deltaproteobacteria bacterium]
MEDRLAGTLVGTALGDALGLPAEGMSARSIARRFGRLDRFRFLGHTGFVSDDTQHSALVTGSLVGAPADVEACVRFFRRALRGWFLRLPSTPPALMHAWQAVKSTGQPGNDWRPPIAAYIPHQRGSVLGDFRSRECQAG